MSSAVVHTEGKHIGRGSTCVRLVSDRGRTLHGERTQVGVELFTRGGTCTTEYC
jgi:hypothetical protein